MKWLYAGAFTASYIVVLVVASVFHNWYIPVNVVFYSALQDALVALLFLSLPLVAIGRKKFTVFEGSLLATIWLLGGYAYAISIPTVLDRSL